MTIPFTILWRVRISATKKAALLGLFSLVAITVAFSIVRIAVTAGPKALKQRDMMWIAMWSVIETSIGLSVYSRIDTLAHVTHSNHHSMRRLLPDSVHRVFAKHPSNV